MTQLQRSIVRPTDMLAPIGAYSHGIRVKAGEFLFVAGQVGLGADGNLVGAGDVSAQARQTFQNIGKVLESVGATFSNVVEFTTYLVGRDSVQPYLDGRVDIFAEIFPNRDYPPNTLLVIDGLVREEFLVEVSAIAALP